MEVARSCRFHFGSKDHVAELDDLDTQSAAYMIQEIFDSRPPNAGHLI